MGTQEIPPVRNKNTQDFHKTICIEEDFILIRLQNDTSQTLRFEREVTNEFIQFYFGLKGKSKCIFNEGHYALELKEDHTLLLYNPQKDLPICLELGATTWSILVLISIKKLHSLFSNEANYITFLSKENRDKKYYNEAAVSPVMTIVLNQIFNPNLLHPSIQNLYYRGKGYELMSLYFNRTEDSDAEQCPFLVDEENILKIRKAKDIIIANMAEPPGLQELADDVGINIKKLKIGFKQIYGDSVYSFLFEYKMEFARKLLESGSYNVNEVGLKIGYSTASHFITAFKKKFGITPKKYASS